MLCSFPSAPRLGETLDERNAMLFARRAIQRRLNELRGPLGDAAVDILVARLNQPDSHRLAIVWETVLLDALSKHGTLGLARGRTAARGAKTVRQLRRPHTGRGPRSVETVPPAVRPGVTPYSDSR